MSFAYDEECGDYVCNDEPVIRKIEEDVNERIRRDEIVTLDDVYNELGIPFPQPTYTEEGDLMDPHEWGWSKNDGFHRLTIKEMNPCGCPFCGRKWD